MYYSITTKLADKRFRLLTSTLVLAISLFIFQEQLFADLKNQSAEEYRLKGYEEQQKGNFSRALTFYSKAISLGLGNAIVYNDIGVVYEQLGVKDKAEEYYLKAIGNNPDYLPSYTNLAFFYEAQGNNDRASYYFEQRLERGKEDDPWQERVRNELKKINPEYEARKLHQEARDLNEQVVNEARKDFSLQIERSEKHYQRGREYLSTADYDKALTELDSALALTPDNPKIIKARDLATYERDIEDVKRHVTVAVDKLNAGDLESAKKEFQEILTLIPNESIQKSK